MRQAGQREPGLAPRGSGQACIGGGLFERQPCLAPQLAFGQRAAQGERYRAFARISLRGGLQARQPFGAQALHGAREGLRHSGTFVDAQFRQLLPEWPQPAASLVDGTEFGSTGGRGWLRPFWEQLSELGVDERAAVAQALAGAMQGLGPEWLPRLEAASQAYPREGSIALALGCALTERQLWGKARLALEQSAADAGLPAAARRKAWLALARLAQQEGDAARVARCFEAAARLP